MSYIGCTTDIEKKRAEHKDNKLNKFGRALTKYGYDNFQVEMSETVKLSKIQEVFDIEYMVIIKYDSIKHGCDTRRNFKDKH